MALDQPHNGVSQSLPPMKARETAAQRRRATAMRIGSLAAAGHHAAGDLQEHFPQIALYMHDTAAGFEHISSFLRDPNLDEVANFIDNLGRKQPAAVVAGVFLVAIGLSWFLRSSSEASDGGAYGTY
jgi:hypothetical protein